MEERLIVFGESGAAWILAIGSAFAAVILAYGSHVEAQIISDGPLAPVMDAYREAFHQHYGKAALTVLGGAVASAWKSYKRKRKRMLGY